MYATIRRYEGIDESRTAEITRAANEKLIPRLSELPGFNGELIQPGDDAYDDARKLLNGGDTAATEYFRSKTTPRLTTAFRPVVEQSMNQVGVSRQYKDLVGRFDSIPFAKSQAFDLDGYVVDKGLGGLFTVLGEQEKQIRTNPTARATDLLKEVFKR